MLRRRCTSVITALTECGDTAGFGPPAESLSLCSRERESDQRESAPDIRVWPAARLPSLRCRSGGTSRRGVPAPSFLARRPCLASPCATPPLGLLTGNGVRAAWKAVGIASLALLFLHMLTGDTNRPFQAGEWNRCVRDRAGWMRREARRSKDGRCQPAPGAAVERTNSARGAGLYVGASGFGYLFRD